MKVLPDAQRPLKGIVVVDFSQFLSGPYCTLKLADLGARVIKIERPKTGDLCRHLYLSDTDIDGDNSLFHAINRNKESFVANLRDDTDRNLLLSFLKQADVMVQNFRPGVMERHGLGYDDVHKLNPRLIYGSISGYGEQGAWRDLPGQDLLAQARTGILWLTGSKTDPPMPMGLAVADMLAGSALAQGITAALVGRSVHGHGCKIDTSLLEALVDFQFEVLATHLNDGKRLPERSAVNGAHAYLGAPYGIYRTQDGFLAIAMTPSLERLADLLAIAELKPYCADPKALLVERDAIKAILAEHLVTKTTAAWLAVLQPADIWCSEVLDWQGLLASDSFQQLDFLQTIRRRPDLELTAVRNPVRIDDQVLKSAIAAPALGEHTQKLISEFSLANTA